jgi:hypothetical protein
MVPTLPHRSVQWANASFRFGSDVAAPPCSPHAPLAGKRRWRGRGKVTFAPGTRFPSRDGLATPQATPEPFVTGRFVGSGLVVSVSLLGVHVLVSGGTWDGGYPSDSLPCEWHAHWHV